MHTSILYRSLAVCLGALVLFAPSRSGAQEAVADRSEASTDYKLSPQDVLTIAVVGEKDLMQECRVSSSGTITYAWLSNVEVAGKTAGEVEQLLRKKLDEDYLVEPTVLVAVKEYRVKEVTVMGFVNRPGAVIIPAEQKLTVVDAISKAGGIARGGDPNKIHYQRRGSPNKQVLRMEELQRTSDPDKIIYIQPGDVIEIRDKPF